MKSNHKQKYKKIEPIINTAGKIELFGETLWVQTTPGMTDNSLAPPFHWNTRGNCSTFLFEQTKG